jgi:hypothetical protein
MRFTKIDKRFFVSRGRQEGSRAEPAPFRRDPLDARPFPFSTAMKSLPATGSKKARPNSPVAIRFAATATRADSLYFMCGIKHNKTIATKTLARCLKSCTHIGFICLVGGLKLN